MSEAWSIFGCSGIWLTISTRSMVDESNLEQVLSAFRRVRAIQAVGSLQHESVRKGTDKISREEIEEEIQAARGGRREKPQAE